MLSYPTSEPLTACNRKSFLSESYQPVEGLGNTAKNYCTFPCIFCVPFAFPPLRDRERPRMSENQPKLTEVGTKKVFFLPKWHIYALDSQH